MIELYDMKKTWAKIRSGFTGGKMFRSPVPRQTHRFADGIDPLVKQSQYQNMPNSTSAFNGKTFSQRKG